jgi:hypothetical protein
LDEPNGEPEPQQHVGRDEFTESVKNTLAWRVGGLCSNRDCMQATKGPHTDDTKVTTLARRATSMPPQQAVRGTTLRRPVKSAAPRQTESAFV